MVRLTSWCQQCVEKVIISSEGKGRNPESICVIVSFFVDDLIKVVDDSAMSAAAAS